MSSAFLIIGADHFWGECSLGSGKILVPAGNISGQTGRRQRIAMLLDQGLSHSRIAAEVDVHVWTVERVSAELRSPREQRQSDLFL